MGWPKNPRPAKSIVKLVEEVNAYRPHRDTSSDGMLGDAAHASRASDHNPWVKDGEVGVVTAVDIDEDENGLGWHLVNTIVNRRDPRVKYIIYEGKIWRSYDKVINGKLIHAWIPSPYTGSNPHDKHLHVSVLPEKRFYDLTATWGIEPEKKPETDMEWIYRVRAEVLAITGEALPHISQKRVFSRRTIWAIRRLALALPKPKK